jgi:hypothetical protein
MLTRLMGLAIFSGGLPALDVDRAFIAVWRIGRELQLQDFRVLRMPDYLRVRLCHPLDDFFEVHWTGEPDDNAVGEVWDAVKAAVAPYAGYADDFGPTEPDHVPFTSWFGVGDSQV